MPARLQGPLTRSRLEHWRFNIPLTPGCCLHCPNAAASLTYSPEVYKRKGCVLRSIARILRTVFQQSPLTVTSCISCSTVAPCIAQSGGNAPRTPHHMVFQGFSSLRPQLFPSPLRARPGHGTWMLGTRPESKSFLTARSLSHTTHDARSVLWEDNSLEIH